MSTWTNITGIIWFEWFSFSYPDKKKVIKDTKERYNYIIEQLEKNKPEGSEGPIWYNFTSDHINHLIILGSLRDFDKEKINKEFKPWWDNLMNIPYVRQAICSCTSSRETHIFEKRIKHDADLGGKLLELYGPDPGIIIHTNRNIIKNDK